MAAADLDKLIQQCHTTMTCLEQALTAGNLRAGQRFQGQAETLRDALESQMTPQDLNQGANLLETKGQLDDAIVRASTQLDQLDDRIYTSASQSGLFGNASYAEHHGSVHVDDFDLERLEF